MVNRILVGAHYGLKDWIIQRATAIIMAVYTIIFLVVVGAVGPDSFDAWRGIFANGFMRFATFLFFVRVFYHAWIGVRENFCGISSAMKCQLSVCSLVIKPSTK